jgi:hypothetical protein
VQRDVIRTPRLDVKNAEHARNAWRGCPEMDIVVDRSRPPSRLLLAAEANKQAYEGVKALIERRNKTCRKHSRSGRL